MDYIVELVTRDAPYITLGYVGCESRDNLKITRDRSSALIISDEKCLNHVLSLINKHNNDNSKIRVMDWITKTNARHKRVFANEITF